MERSSAYIMVVVHVWFVLQVRERPVKLMVTSLNRRPWVQTVSYALEISRKIAIVDFLFEKLDFISDSNFVFEDFAEARGKSYRPVGRRIICRFFRLK